jgi:hypothetical protein
MKAIMLKHLLIPIACLCMMPLATDGSPQTPDALPAIITANPQAFTHLKIAIRSDPKQYENALQKLKLDADKALNTLTRAITPKSVMGPSEDPHDYVSLSPYYWPNPKTPDGMPWIHRDDEINPMRDQYDLPVLENMTCTVLTLSIRNFSNSSPKK